jgi:hypothetical protein
LQLAKNLQNRGNMVDTGFVRLWIKDYLNPMQEL